MLNCTFCTFSKSTPHRLRNSDSESIYPASSESRERRQRWPWQEALIQIGRCHTVVRALVEGSPFVEIIRYAWEQDIDLIVLPTHGQTGLVHVMLGSVVEKVVRKAPCPVLTIRPDGHHFVMP